MEPAQKPKTTYIVVPKPNLKALIGKLTRPGKNLKKISPDYLTPLSILIAGAFIAASIALSGAMIAFGTNPYTQKQTSSTTTPAAPTQPGNQAAQAGQPTAADVEKLSEGDHVRGDRNARVLMIEYSDLECPFCKSFHPTAQKALSEYSGKIAWVYRHFPLDPIHSKADKEAEAAECAAEQGGNDAFWKFVDKVFEVTPSNNGLDPAQLPQIATQIGLDGNKLKSCLDSGKMAQKVESQYQGGVKAGVNGTPTSFLLDTKTGKSNKVAGAYPYDQLKPQIDSMLDGSQK